MKIVSQDKTAAYLDMVKARQACRACIGVLNPSVIEDGIFDHDEIGAWSLWQGNLNAEVMVVAQDWGDVAWFNRVKGIPTSTSTTNRTLVKLLQHAGLHIELYDQTPTGGRTPNSKSGPLFFTNAILCMKEGGAYGAAAPIKREWLHNCGHFLRRTIDIVQPKAVVCLGAKAYGGIMAAYNMICLSQSLRKILHVD